MLNKMIDILRRIKQYMDGVKANAEATYGISEMKRIMSESEPYTDKGLPMLDIGLAFDHPNKLYQIQLYAQNITTQDMVIAVLAPQRLEKILLDLRRYSMAGYLPTGDGTVTPGVRLPCEAEKMMEKWK